MEEDDVELIDYLRVIWKRKILIIVGTLVCIVAGAVWDMWSPVTYRAEILVRIGKTVSSGFTSPSFVAFDTLGNLAKTIPAKYGLGEEESLEYNLSVEMIKETSLIKITLEGTDERKTKELLGKVVGKLIADHLRKTESAIQFYKVLIGELETDINEIQNDLAREALESEDMSMKIEKEINMMMDQQVSNEANIEADIDKPDPVTMMMIQSRSIAIQNNILRMKESAKNNVNQGRINIRSIQNDILLHKLTTKSLMENKTRIVGDVKNTAIEPKKKRNIILAGVAGLTMFLFLAFFIEYLRNVRKRDEGGE